MYIHQRAENGAKRSNGQRNHRVHPQESYLSRRAVDPDVDEGHDSVEDGKEKGEDETEHKHKEVVGEELDVFVGEPQYFVVDSNGLCALVLVEAFLEVQLKG